jgi:hypothetical protein
MYRRLSGRRLFRNAFLSAVQSSNNSPAETGGRLIVGHEDKNAHYQNRLEPYLAAARYRGNQAEGNKAASP